MKILKVAIIQTDIVWEDKEANLNAIEVNYFSKIHTDQVDLIILPEMFATGFTMRPSEFWEDQTGLTFQWLKNWAQKLGCSIGAGVITKNEDGYYQNTFLVYSKSGDVCHYEKRHLFRMGEENQHYVAGQNPIILKLNNWKINLQICYDLRFPAFARNHIKTTEPAYDAMIYIANWPEIRTYAWTNLLRSRAIENQAFVIGVNRTGIDGNAVSHSGESAVIDPNGQYLLNPVVNEEGLFILELNSLTLSSAREKFPVLLDADQISITDNPSS